MISDPFNAVGGLTVGIPPVPVVAANGNVVTNVVALSGNVSANRFFANAYFYGNGQPFSSTPAGTNTQIQFNQSGTLGASANLTFDYNNSIFTTSTINVTKAANLGNVANLKITGGTLGYYLQTDGTGNLQWAPGGGGNGGAGPGGGNTQVQFNNNGNFGGVSGFTFNSSTGALTVPNLTVTGTLTASIPGSSITGQVEYAAVANSVAGANVTGGVAFATTANGVAGSNVFGPVNFAVVAYSVSGANVVGPVQYASVANSVAGANVTGQVGYASIANNVAGGNVTGAVHYASVANLVAGANVTGQVEYAGTANLVAGGNVTGQVAFAAIANNVAGGNVTGPVGALEATVQDVVITGGLNGYVLQTDGLGNLSWTAQTGGGGGNGVPGGSNTQVQFNKAGTFGGQAGFTYNNITNTLAVSTFAAGNISSNTTLISTGTANFSQASNVNLGNVGNITISGGTSGYVLTTDGLGNLNWTAGGGGGSTPSGSNTQVQFNNNGSFGSNAAFTFNQNTLTLSTPNFVTNNITANAGGAITVLGNLNAGISPNVFLGTVSNVKITGGTSGYYLQTDGTGNLSWAAGGGGGGGNPGGANTQVQFNTNGTFAGSPYLTFNDVTNTFNVAGNLIANSLTIGSGVYQFSVSNVYAAISTTTASTALLSLAANTISGVDFTIVATNASLGTRQITKLSVVLYNASLNYNEYSSLYVGGPVGTFAVSYNPGNIIAPATAILTVLPSDANLTVYKVQITQYEP